MIIGETSWILYGLLLAFLVQISYDAIGDTFGYALKKENERNSSEMAKVLLKMVSGLVLALIVYALIQFG
jgi:hypothetical protein